MKLRASVPPRRTGATCEHPGVDEDICDLCDLRRTECVHGLAARRPPAPAPEHTGPLLISPTNMAHFPGCGHKEGDPDFSEWAELDTPNAWTRLGNGERLQATGGARPDRIASTRCKTCEGHGPW